MVLVLILSGGLMFIMVKVVKGDLHQKSIKQSERTEDMKGSRKYVLEEEF